MHVIHLFFSIPVFLKSRMNVLKISFAIAAECDSLPRCLTHVPLANFSSLFPILMIVRDLSQHFSTRSIHLSRAALHFSTRIHSKKSGRWTRKMDREERESSKSETMDRYIYIYIRRARHEAQATRTNGI